MCTAISINEKYNLFGRTLDLELSYGEMLVITPKKFCVDFLHEETAKEHLAIMGVACVQNEAPLYYDALNETGLVMAALNFPRSAVYHKALSGKRNIASFELIPWVLCQCESISQAIELLEETNITADSFSTEFPATPLHWIIADKNNSITAESTKDGLLIYQNPFGELTNEPAFPYHYEHICDFMLLDSKQPENNLCPTVKLSHYSSGMGAIGLPGDFSSSSRFVRAVFAKNHTDISNTENEAVSRFFRIMDTVSVPHGCVKTANGQSVETVYTSCAAIDSLTYYVTASTCRRIKALRLHDALLDSEGLISFPINTTEDVSYFSP